MKKAGLAVIVVILLLAPAAARAETRALDPVPAATLLLPYFEVDLLNTSGVTTLFSVNNASATAVLAHVTLWTDLGIPTYAFDMYLTGYDVQTIDLRRVFMGFLPVTASDGQDPLDIISNQGPISQDINFASCTGKLPPPNAPQGPPPPPFGAPPTGPHIAAETKRDMRDAHTGWSVKMFQNRCAGQPLRDNIARGFVTVDTVVACTDSKTFPGTPGYLAPNFQGIVSKQNVIWGDYSYVNPGDNFAQGDTLVHIEAAGGTGAIGSTPNDPELQTPGQYTFYGRFSGWTAADEREPLATTFGIRYQTGGVNSDSTFVTVWRDPKAVRTPFTCGVAPAALGQENLVAFDEQENVVALSGTPFPAVANSVEVGGPQMPVPFQTGWIYANLNHSAAANPPEDPLAAQAWVTVRTSSEGRFSVGHPALQIDNATQALHRVLLP